MADEAKVEVTQEDLDLVEEARQKATAELKDDFNRIGYSLSRYHGIFSKLYAIGRVEATFSIPTAAVGMCADWETAKLFVNPEFWKPLTFRQKQFIFCHEMLHVIFGHVDKFLNYMDPKLRNIAADVVINEMLVSEFKFSKIEVDPANILIWHDNVFGKEPFTITYPQGVERGRETEYYYNILLEAAEEEEGDGEGQGDHSLWGIPQEGDGDADPNGNGKAPSAADAQKAKEIREKAVQDAIDSLSPEQQKDLKEKLKNGPGSQEGSEKYTFKTKRVRLDHTWKKLIRVMVGKQAKVADYTWLKENRRLGAMRDRKKYLLPAPGPRMMKNRKPQVWLFMDVSGSCIHMKQDFWDARESIPKSLFDVRTFTFDTRVNEVFNKDFQGGGGTDFQCIENFILKKENGYPAHVWVITDGEASTPYLKHPERWSWLIDKASNWGYGVPKECKSYHLHSKKPYVYTGTGRY